MRGVGRGGRLPLPTPSPPVVWPRSLARTAGGDWLWDLYPYLCYSKKKIYGHLPLDKLSPKGSESGPAGLGLDHLQNRTANKQTTGDREGEKGKEAKQTNTTRGIPLSWSQLVWSLGCGCVAAGAGCRVGG